MPRTITIPLSDAAIRRHLLDQEVYQLKDDKHPVIIRYNKARTSASWHVVKYHKGRAIWRKVGSWPTVKLKAVVQRLPDISVQMSVDPNPDKLRVGQMQTVGQVLAWYLNRTQNNGHLSPKRKSSIKTAIKRHLSPKLSLYRLNKLDRKIIDKELLWPLQSEYSLSTVRMVFSCLKVALKQAEKLHLIESDPMAGMKFTDFITTPIKPKDARIRPDQLHKVFKSLKDEDPKLQLLIKMMVMHGTRLSETLMMKWSDLNLRDGWWYIPIANTKTRKANEIPLSHDAVELLKDYRRYKTGPYVFAGRGKNHWSDSAASRAIRILSKKEWSAHDLRKALASAWPKLGIDYVLIKFVLNHSLSRVDKTYIQTYADNQLRAALTKYHEWLKNEGLTTVVNQDNAKIHRSRK